jgi:sialate O-acetylesterase
MYKYLMTSLAVITTFLVRADVKPAPLFSDNMVIQRETQAPIWGWADPGEKISVKGSWGIEGTATANAEGKWALKLETPKAGGPHTLTFQGTNTVKLKNVLSGDVWLCSGQSNMQWTVGRSKNVEEEAKKANYPNIRHFTVGYKASKKAEEEFKGKWQICSPSTVKRFTATGYFTGRELHKKLKIPIGLINSSRGGTIIETWTNPSELTNDIFAQRRKQYSDKKAASYNPEQAKAKYDAEMKEWKLKAAAAKTEKKKMPRHPRRPKDPLADANYPGNLYNGMIHPLLTYAIKGVVWYQGESNSGSVKSGTHYRNQLSNLINTWRKAWKQDFPFYAVQLPNFRAPQTEPVEIKAGWPFTRESIVHVSKNTLNVGTASMIDIGEAKNIHPTNKQDVGFRMASTILNKTYGKKTPTTPFMKSFNIEGNKVVVSFDYCGSGLVAKGGALKAFAIAGADKKFVHAKAVIEKRQDNDVVVVWSDEVTTPKSVRYGWGMNPPCNLYSIEGFPASPFRTDAW